MKKIVSVLFLAACLLTAIPAKAQINFGLKGGLNLNKASLSGLNSNFKSENTAGFFIGPMVDITVPVVGLGVDGALLFSQRTIKIAQEDGAGAVVKDVNHDQNAIEIPLNLKYSFGLGDLVSLFIAAGPDFIFTLNNDNLLEDIYHMAGVSGEPDGKDKAAQVALNLGVGAKFLNHLQLGVNYNIPLTNSVEGTGENSTIMAGNKFKTKNKTWQVSVAYIF